MEKKVTIIPATKDRTLDNAVKRVGIYCRVSSAKKKQLKSLAAQVSGLMRFVVEHSTIPYKNAFWQLKDIYVDVAPGSDNDREQYNRMLRDPAAEQINLVVVKSSSRLGRNTAEVIRACRDLEHFGCDIYFQDADSFYSEIGALAVEITAAVDHDENENRGNNIRWSIRRSVQDETSTIYDRVCYGYEHDPEGQLIIREDQAVIVRKIFTLYLSGASILTIKRKLEEENIPAPRGGNTWSKKTIESILTNIKYTGCSIVHSRGFTDSGSGELLQNDLDWNEVYESIDNHPAIISRDSFDSVQQMRLDRSNIVFNPDGTKSRRSTHYSSKKGLQDNLAPSVY